MEKTNKILLNNQRLPNNVNVNTQLQIGLENTNKPLPLNDIDTTVSEYEQFQKERKESTIYRFYGVINPLISNPIFNDNIKIYEGLDEGGSVKILNKKIFSSNIFEKDGWIGYYNDEIDVDALQSNDRKSALCEFFPFDPGYDRLKFLDSDGIPNYLIKITYPFESRNDIVLVRNNVGITINDGIPIISKFSIELNGRLYTGFKTVMNHGLSDGDNISLLNFIDDTLDNSLKLNKRFFRVIKVGNRTNDDKLRSFVIDVEPQEINFNIGVSTIKRVVRGVESKYYIRRFKSITTNYTDYDLYPAAYGTSYFTDDVAAFNFKTDIDVKDLKDNLGRPLTELYLTVLKNDNDADQNSINTQYWLEQQKNLDPPNNNRFWTSMVGGYDLEKNENVNYNIRSYGDDNYINSLYYENIDESDEIFDGDIIEYNDNELLERVLENIYHRFNTVYREKIVNKREGYIYTPFNIIQIKEFSNYIHPIVNFQSILDKYNITNPNEIVELKKSFGIPDYAFELSTNVYKWRDILGIGEVDGIGDGVEYPFISGAHYMYLNERYYLQRQDPPCEFTITSKKLGLGSQVPPENEDLFLSYLSEPTYLNYEFESESDWASSIDNVGNVSPSKLTNNDLINYNGVDTINIFVNFVSFFGDYNLGTRDVAGGCVDLSLLKQKDIDDVC